MNKKVYLIIVHILFVNYFLQSQDFLSIDNNWYSPNYQASKAHISMTQILNKSKEYVITVDSIILVNPRFDIAAIPTKSKFQLNKNNLDFIGFRLHSKHNLTYKLRYYVYYTINQLNTQVVYLYNIFPSFSYSDEFEDFTHNITGLKLKNLLQDYLQSHTALSYREAREKMFGEIDNKDGWVECIYTGRKIQTTGIPDVNQTGFNTEHTWPQAFFNEGDTASRSDLFHIYPCDETANNKRANYPFDSVAQIQWQEGNSKLGKNINGEIVFEPRDEIKGNIARGLFYFSLRYNNPKQFLNSQETILRRWSIFDTVDSTEVSRNIKIHQIQNKSNPFIVHPEFLERIFSISTDQDFADEEKPVLSTTYSKVSSSYIDNINNFNVYITNSGNVNLTLSNIEFIHRNGGLISEIKGLSLPTEIPVDSVLTISNNLFNSPNEPNQITTVKLTINDKIYEYTLEEDLANSIGYNSKNTIIIYHDNELIINTDNNVKNIQIFDILGNKISVINNMETSKKHPLFLKSGIYYVLLQSDKSSIIEKITILN